MLRGRCIQLVGSGLPYLPLVDALRPLRGTAALDAAAASSCTSCRGCVPELAGRAGAGSRDAGARRLAPAGCSRRCSPCSSTSARRAPLVLVLEDLHWADESTLDLLAFLVHAIRERQVLLAGDVPQRRGRVRATTCTGSSTGLSAPARRSRCELEPLARDDVEALLAASDDGAAAAPS